MLLRITVYYNQLGKNVKNKILEIIPKSINNDYMIYFMENNLETLAQFVARLMFEKKLTSYDIEQRSGGNIGQATVIKIKNGRSTNPTKRTLLNLAKGLGVPYADVFNIATGNPVSDSVDDRLENLSLKFSGLPDDKKQELDPLIAMMDREIDRIASKK